MAEQEIMRGSQVTLHFSLALFDGSEAISTFDEEPATLTIGEGAMVPTLEMAIYGLKAPDVDASKPARTWQALDITFRNARFDRRGKKTENARMTVLLNGVKIHDDVEIKSRCPTLMEPEGPSPGPIVLENHGSRGHVRFRNIWIVPR